MHQLSDQIRSFILLVLPATSGDSGDSPLGGIFAEAETAHAKVAHISARASANLATVVLAYFELGSSLLLDNH